MNFLKPTKAKIFATIIVIWISISIGFDCSLYPDDFCGDFPLNFLINIYEVPFDLLAPVIHGNFYLILLLVVIVSYIISVFVVELIKYFYANKNKNSIKIFSALIILFLIFALVPFLVTNLM